MTGQKGSSLRHMRSLLVPCVSDCTLWSQPEMLPWKGRGRKQDGKSHGREAGPYQQQQCATLVAAGVPSHSQINAFSCVTARRYICMDGWAGLGVSISLAKVFPCVSCGVAEVLEQWIWGIEGIRMRDNVPVSAQAFATVVALMRPLVPWSFCSCGEAKKGAETCAAAAGERCREHCLPSVRKSLKWPAAALWLKLFSCPRQWGIFFLPVGCHRDASALHPSRLLKLGNDR